MRLPLKEKNKHIKLVKKYLSGQLVDNFEFKMALVALLVHLEGEGGKNVTRSIRQIA